MEVEQRADAILQAACPQAPPAGRRTHMVAACRQLAGRRQEALGALPAGRRHRVVGPRRAWRRHLHSEA